jgi:peptide/nickel transport system permease protein
MPFVPVILYTDALLWLLVLGLGSYAWYCARRAHLAAPWRRVFQSRAAVASATVLAAFVLVGLADSVHFRRPPSIAEQSLLDVALGHLRARTEKTYSAPLATRLYAKEQIELPGGRTARDYPRLRYGGSHLADEAQAPDDIIRLAMRGLLYAGMVLALLFFLLDRFLRSRLPRVPWSAGWVALAVVLALAGPALSLSAHWHVLGTDKVGNDVLFQSLKAIRTSLVIGTLTTLVLLPLGVALGVIAGYFKGWIDDAIQYVYTTLNSIPGVLLIAAAVLMMQVVIERNPEWFATAAQRADFRLLVLCAILGLTSWTGLARLLRGEALKLSQLEYIQAAHAFGVSDARILGRHILPNVAHIVIIAMVMDFSGLVLAEAVLSYVGVGVDPATTSFGTMINAARLEMGREPVVWWSLAAAFFFMFVLVLAANLFADAVRDGFDPRVRVGGAVAA